jgi:hypothetical protein
MADRRKHLQSTRREALVLDRAALEGIQLSTHYILDRTVSHKHAFEPLHANMIQETYHLDQRCLGSERAPRQARRNI